MPWKKGNRLHVVSEREAPPEIRAIYGEIQQYLGTPFVSQLFQVYASYPRFLAAHWKMLRPVVDSGEFFRLAERLRADAYTRACNYFDIVNFCPQLESYHFSEGAKHELNQVIDLFNYLDPLLLLIAAAQQQAFDGVVGNGRVPQLPSQRSDFEIRPVLVDEESAEPDPRRIFDEIKQTSGLPFVTQEIRALARWPDFLRVYWNFLHPLLASPIYSECSFGIQESAWSLVKELPGSMELPLEHMTSAGMSEDDIASVVRLTQAFNRGLSSALLNISIAKIGMEGGNRVELSPREKQTAFEQESSPNQAA